MLMKRQLSAVNSDVSSAFFGQNIESSIKGQSGPPTQVSFLSYNYFPSCPISKFHYHFSREGLLMPEIVAGRLHQLLIFCVVGN